MSEVQYVDKDSLFTKDTSEEDLEVPGRGWMRIRALTRAQALELRNSKRDIDDIERQILEWGLVTPKITVGEARLWQEASKAGEIEPIVEAISRLSGMDQGKAKMGVKQFPGKP